MGLLCSAILLATFIATSFPLKAQTRYNQKPQVYSPSEEEKQVHLLRTEMVPLTEGILKEDVKPTDVQNLMNLIERIEAQYQERKALDPYSKPDGKLQARIYLGRTIERAVYSIFGKIVGTRAIGAAYLMRVHILSSLLRLLHTSSALPAFPFSYSYQMRRAILKVLARPRMDPEHSSALENLESEISALSFETEIINPEDLYQFFQRLDQVVQKNEVTPLDFQYFEFAMKALKGSLYLRTYTVMNGLANLAIHLDSYKHQSAKEILAKLTTALHDFEEMSEFYIFVDLENDTLNLRRLKLAERRSHAQNSLNKQRPELLLAIKMIQKIIRISAAVGICEFAIVGSL